MIEMDVATRRKPVAVIDDPPWDYLVLGDFGGCTTGPLQIDRNNFDEVLDGFEVHVGSTRFHKLDDFHPDRLCQRVPLLSDFNPMTAAASREEKIPNQPPPDFEVLLRSSSLLEQITEGIDPFQQCLHELTRAYASPAQSSPDQSSPDQSSPNRFDAATWGAALGERMRSALHHPPFQAIESAWRGVHFLARSMSSGTNDGARVFLAQYSRDDLNRDLLSNGVAGRGGSRIEQLLNARPWRAIGGLYHFGPDASNIELLGQLALLATQVRAPFLSACSLSEGSANMGPYWSGLTATPEAGYLGLVLPRFLLRLPYGARTAPIDSFAFEEMPGVPVHSRYLWGNPVFACLSLLARGEGALDLTGLPSYQVESHEKDGEAITTPCEVPISDVRELALIEAGLMPLVPSSRSDCARLAGFRAINGKELPLA